MVGLLEGVLPLSIPTFLILSEDNIRHRCFFRIDEIIRRFSEERRVLTDLLPVVLLGVRMLSLSPFPRPAWFFI